MPDVVKRTPIQIGKDVPSMLKSDLELNVVIKCARGHILCENIRIISRDMLQVLLVTAKTITVIGWKKQLFNRKLVWPPPAPQL